MVLLRVGIDTSGVTHHNTGYLSTTATIDSLLYLRCCVITLKQELTFFVVHLATHSTAAPDSIDRKFKNMSLGQGKTQVLREKPVPVPYYPP